MKTLLITVLDGGGNACDYSNLRESERQTRVARLGEESGGQGKGHDFDIISASDYSSYVCSAGISGGVL